jgi:hypothetical protein
MPDSDLWIPGLVRSLSSGGAKAPTRWDHPGMTKEEIQAETSRLPPTPAATLASGDAL